MGDDTCGPLAPVASECAVPQLPLPFTWIEHLMPPPEPMFLVDGIIPRAGLSIVYGPPAAGKSYLMNHLAGCVAVGREFFGRRVEQGAVILLVFESIRGARMRLYAAKMSDPALQRAPIAVVDVMTPLRGSEQQLLATIQLIKQELQRSQLALRLIIVDTFSRALGSADENSSADMGAMLALLEMLGRFTGAAIVAVGHTGKQTANGMRGHSSALGACETAWEVKTSGGERRIVECVKNKDGPSDLSFAFELEPITITCGEPPEARTTCRVRELSDAVAGKVKRDIHPTDALILKTLSDLQRNEAAGASQVADAPIRIPRKRLTAELGAARPAHSTAMNWSKHLLRRCEALRGKGLIGSEKGERGEVMLWLIEQDVGRAEAA